MKILRVDRTTDKGDTGVFYAFSKELLVTERGCKITKIDLNELSQEDIARALEHLLMDYRDIQDHINEDKHTFSWITLTVS